MTDANIHVVSFHDSEIPTFKESETMDYVAYGSDNKYDSYLLYLYGKSAKHGAILSGKADYVFGKGFDNGDFKINLLDESLNDVVKKCIIDLVIFGGYRVEATFDRDGFVSEIYHVDFSSLRTAKSGSGFFYKKKWGAFNNQDAVFIKSFDQKARNGSCIYAYNEYRPAIRHYPLPEYIHSANFIETDIEISKYYLSTIRNGMIPSKMIQFFNGDQTDEQKRNIERRLTEKTAGAENAGKMFLVFNNGADKSVEVSDLSATNLDKQFIEMNKMVQQEIFSGHKVTTPALFGIKTEGQLGSSQELKTGYAIFLSAYAVPKAKLIEKEFNWLLSFSRYGNNYSLRQIDPIGWEVPDSMLEKILTTDEARERLGLKALTIAPVHANGEPIVQTSVNEHLKNLTGRQNQQLQRVVKQYQSGKITADMAKVLLQGSLGLSDLEIEKVLGIQSNMQSNIDEDDEFGIGVFSTFGENKDAHEVIISESMRADFQEDSYIKDNFSVFSPSKKDLEIIDLIKKDPLINEKTLAKAIGESAEFVAGKIASFKKRGYLEVAANGEISVIKEFKILFPTKKKADSIKVMYSYEGPKDSRNRNFCAKLLELNRFYDRKDIERMSDLLGYNVFDRRGGFWNNGSKILPHCRHNWKANIVRKK